MQFGDTPISTSSFNGLLFDPIPAETRERLLRFPLGDRDTVLLPLEQITEILSVDLSEILPIPEMPACVLGICNWRGEMLWLIDFNHFVGCPSPFQQEQPLTPFTAIVIQQSYQAIGQQSFNQQTIGQQAVGLVVPRVHEIELQDLQQLQPPPIGLFSPDLLPLIRGTLPGCSDAVLDLKSFIHCPLWKKHPKEA